MFAGDSPKNVVLAQAIINLLEEEIACIISELLLLRNKPVWKKLNSDRLCIKFNRMIQRSNIIPAPLFGIIDIIFHK